MGIRTLIVDDEPLARQRLCLLLECHPDIEVVSECGDGKSAARAIRGQHPDLVFLDIQLPEMNGFEMIESLQGEPAPSIIFVTAYDQFALRAFKVHAVDYLLKPVEANCLAQALDQLRNRRFGDDTKIREHLTELVRDLEKQRGTRLALRTDGEILCLKPAEIDWIESAGNYLCVHAGTSTHILRETMSDMERKLRAHNFVRIHRSTIVNLDRVRRLKPVLYGDYFVELRDGTKLNMSRGYRELVLKAIQGSG